MTRTEDSREIALDILMEILEREGLSHQVLRQALSKYQYLGNRGISAPDRSRSGDLFQREGT